LKSFGVPESADINCVLSYAQSVEEHDRKGNRPSAEAIIFDYLMQEGLQEYVIEVEMPGLAAKRFTLL